MNYWLSSSELMNLGACYICYGHFLQDGCLGCENELAEVLTVTNGVSYFFQFWIKRSRFFILSFPFS